MINLRTLFAVTLLSTAVFSSAQAAPNSETLRRLGNQLSEDFAVCSAFYMISAEGAKNRGDISGLQMVALAEASAVKAIAMAKRLSYAIGQKSDVPMIRYRENHRSLLDEMGRDFVNYSVLSARYLRNCAYLMRDPEAVVVQRMGLVE